MFSFLNMEFKQNGRHSINLTHIFHEIKISFINNQSSFVLFVKFKNSTTQDKKEPKNMIGGLLL